jgi:outer membrane protein assembly factor BamA
VIDQVSHGDEARRDLIVTVEEAPATTIGYGAGVEGRSIAVRQADGSATDRFQIAPRASFELTRRNLFGRNRSLSVFTSVSLPKNFANSTELVNKGFVEYRAVGTYREPRFGGTDADFSVTGELEQQIRSSFNFARRTTSATLTHRVASDVLLSESYQLQRTNVFDERLDPGDQNKLDRIFSRYLLSSFALTTIRDTRDDTLNPHDGGVLSANAQAAAFAIGSQASFFKTFFTAQMFRTLPHARDTVFAGSARLGLGFPGQVVQMLDTGGQIHQDADLLPESERFFAGGDTTVRGFALDRLGTPETIVNGFPIGGDGLVIFNAELRQPVFGPLGVVGFFDTGNVFQHANDLDLGSLRSSVGFGIRFASPFGPIRADLGFKVHPNADEGLTAFHLSFGQAF